jgi:NADH:ubiquinone oxidoreductase subunit E/NAD-dependent dihydropyrimidine dehydrogenase PreA subunit
MAAQGDGVKPGGGNRLSAHATNSSCAMKEQTNGEIRIGFYVCHCGRNIAAMVDCADVANYVSTLANVAVSRDYKYMCSDPGQQLIQKDIKDLGLNRVVVASCSPLLHEHTFRAAVEAGGLNPFFFHMVNIREHDSWVHTDREEATEKAKALARAAIERVAHHRALEVKKVPIHPDVLVVGAGIAGIHASLTLANAGKKVFLVEREPSIGGHMAKFDKTFPTLDCAACILTPKMSDVGSHPNITLMTHSQVEGISGYVGNYKVKVRRKARYVDEEKCTGCLQCIERCPVQHKAYPYPAEARENGEHHGLPALPELEPELRKVVDRALQLHHPVAAPLAEVMQGILVDRRSPVRDAVRAPLIAVLQDINSELGYLPEPALRYVSRRVKVPLISVYHVATFYKAFSLQPRGKHLIRVCLGTACHVRGAQQVLEAIKGKLQIEPGQTTKDRKFTLETVNCLGTCALAPVVTIDSKYSGNMTPPKVNQALKPYQ